MLDYCTIVYTVKLQAEARVKGMYVFAESTDVFVITSNRRTFFFPETENSNFGNF